MNRPAGSTRAPAAGRPAGDGDALGVSDVPLAEAHDVALLDLDGVLYVGPEPVPHAAEALRAVRERGLAAAYVTNNASRSPTVVAAHLRDLGIDAAAGDVVTSAQAAARVLAENLDPGDPVLVVGTEALAAEVRARGLAVVDSADARPRAVVQGFHPGLRWADLAEAAYALAAGALWVASNTDTSVPTPRGRAPGNGAFVAALAATTGLTPLVAGKPEPALHLESVERTAARHPLVVGDRLDTDVLGAVRAGCPSLLVLTGVTDVGHLLAAPPGERPTHVGPDLRALLLPQPPVTAEDGGWSCDGWLVAEGDGLVVSAVPGTHDTGAAAEVAVLRALCAASWARGGVPAGEVSSGDEGASTVLDRLLQG